MPKLKTVLITGATGLVGGDILRYFHSNNWNVIMATSTKNIVSMDKRINIVPFDLANIPANLFSIDKITQLNAVIHAAAIIPRGNKLEHYDDSQVFLDNIAGTFKLIEQSVKCKVKQFVYISSANIYEQVNHEVKETFVPKPANHYLLSKWLGEEIANYFSRQGSTKFCNLRISAPYGPGYKIKAVIPILVERALKGEDLELWGSGLREQVFTYVRDISRACEMVIEKEINGTFNITGPGPVSMIVLANNILKVIQNTGSKTVFNGKQDPNEGLRRRLSIEAAKDAFSYEPLFDISAGIEDMVKHILNKPQPLYDISTT
ncbi:MAG: UDP-glucose 4-epimerase [Nitrospirae bacterium]|nr:MAG: UDP-glucose 4-epimerase [Nitrospirota bacterium]